MSYLDATRRIYADAARSPRPGLCCTTSPRWVLPGLEVPERMEAMSYGCGTTVHPRDLGGSPTVLYVGVGGGLELLQFAYFSRRPGAVVGVDPVPEMLAAARENLERAEGGNNWFSPRFVELRDGDALRLPVEDGSIDVAAQNCLFNIFEEPDLAVALREMHRVLRPRGRLVMSDPVAPRPLPGRLATDERLRALCLTGATTIERYLEMIVAAGFGTVEVRARRPYRVLDPERFGTAEPIVLESLEIAAVKDPIPTDGACVFTGRTAIFFGGGDTFDDGRGHVLIRDAPLAVCDKTAAALERLGRSDIVVTPPTWFYDGGGCC